MTNPVFLDHPDFFQSMTGIFTDLSKKDIFHAVSGNSVNVINALHSSYPIRLSWTHYCIIPVNMPL